MKETKGRAHNSNMFDDNESDRILYFHFELARDGDFKTDDLCLQTIFILQSFDGLSGISKQNFSNFNEMQTKGICNVAVLWWFTHIIRYCCQPNQPIICFFFCLCSHPLLSFSIFVGAEIRIVCCALHLSFLFMFICFLSIVEAIQLVVKNLSSCHFCHEKVQKSTVSSQNTRISHYLFIDFGSQHRIKWNPNAFGYWARPVCAQ